MSAEGFALWSLGLVRMGQLVGCFLGEALRGWRRGRREWITVTPEEEQQFRQLVYWDSRSKPMPNRRVVIPFHRASQRRRSPGAAARPYPGPMGDHWVGVLHEGSLDFYHSWTGYHIYRLCLRQGGRRTRGRRGHRQPLAPPVSETRTRRVTSRTSTGSLIGRFRGRRFERDTPGPASQDARLEVSKVTGVHPRATADRCSSGDVSLAACDTTNLTGHAGAPARFRQGLLGKARAEPSAPYLIADAPRVPHGPGSTVMTSVYNKSSARQGQS